MIVNELSQPSQETSADNQSAAISQQQQRILRKQHEHRRQSLPLQLYQQQQRLQQQSLMGQRPQFQTKIIGKELAPRDHNGRQVLPQPSAGILRKSMSMRKRKESNALRSPSVLPEQKAANIVEQKRRASVERLRESQEIDGKAVGPPKYVEYQPRENLTY